MICDLTSDSPTEEQLHEVLLAYVEATEAGLAPDRSQLLALYPSVRRELEEFFASHDEVERLAAPFREANQESTQREARVPDADDSSGTALDIQPQSDVTSDIGQLGEFRLLREVGRGGMGVVYEAEQISLRRRVALKVLPFAAAIDPRQLQRFKNEALAAAHLRHENIVPVHAVGAERGVHYYAMQFIEGQSLAALIGELRQARDEGQGTTDESPLSRRHPGSFVGNVADTAVGLRLSTRDMLSSFFVTQHSSFFHWVATLGRQAAQALEHAHQTGIVHRDVKPANLLLDLRGQLWITDFGLAQVHGDAGLTATGELLGTLRYASPEQVQARRGLVDHRSDVYSLGATLYELLTLRPIFDGRDRNELLRQIAEEEPRPPRSVDPAIPAELETIVLRAVGKEPGDRYATAQELADDLQRFLDNRPILARRPTQAERLRKWARRHPSVVAACVAVLLLWSVGSVVSMALIRGEERKAEAAYERERQRAEEAETRFHLARRSVDEMIQVSQEELADRPGQEWLRKRLLTSALLHYQEFIEQRHDDPAAQAELLDTKHRVEKILADLSVLRAASQLYLLGQPAVLDNLHLDDAQRTKVKRFAARVAKQWCASIADVGRFSPVERRRRALGRARRYETEVNELLTPGQQLRLRQIGLQAEGPGAFREPEVVAELKLTPRQREWVRAVEEEALFSWHRPPWPGTMVAGSGKALRSRDRNEPILAVLTPEQSRAGKS